VETVCWWWRRLCGKQSQHYKGCTHDICKFHCNCTCNYSFWEKIGDITFEPPLVIAYAEIMLVGTGLIRLIFLTGCFGRSKNFSCNCDLRDASSPPSLRCDAPSFQKIDNSLRRIH
jgi:hypothetical protein